MSKPRFRSRQTDVLRPAVAFASALSFSTWIFLAMPSCSHENFGRLRVKCPKPDAVLFVDGKYLGPIKLLSDADVRLPAGSHLVEIRHKGFYARYRRIRINRDSVTLLRVDLAPTLDWALPSRRSHRKRTGKATEQ